MISEPLRPTHLAPLAERCLEALAQRGLGQRVSIGGAVGLLHFLDYRSTVDLDAWWQPEATGAQRLEVEEVLERGAPRDFQAKRHNAKTLRAFFAKEFLDALVD